MQQTKVWDPFVRVFHWSLVAGFVANAFLNNPEGKLHHQIGYAIVVLVGLRLVWGLIGSRHARFRDFPPSVAGAFRQLQDIATGRRHVHTGHSPLGALMIYNILATMLLIGLTGWMMGTDAYFGIKWVRTAHELLVTWAEVSVLAHIIAVVVESRRLNVNLPKSMLTGDKELPLQPGLTE